MHHQDAYQTPTKKSTKDGKDGAFGPEFFGQMVKCGPRSERARKGWTKALGVFIVMGVPPKLWMVYFWEKPSINGWFGDALFVRSRSVGELQFHD